VIEVEVHQQLLALLREQGETSWPHHLTMARLVARALRLGRSALIQVGALGSNHPYRLSYLVGVLLWPRSVIIVAPEAIQQELMLGDLPRLQEWLQIGKSVQRGDRWPGADFQGVLLTSPEAWLDDRLHHTQRFPSQIPTIVERVDDLESWFIQHQTRSFHFSHWYELRLALPQQIAAIRDTQAALTHSFFQRPGNPYHCWLLDDQERDLLAQLHQQFLASGSLNALPQPWLTLNQALDQIQLLTWATLDRDQGQFALHWTPLNMAAHLQPVWEQQPVVLIRETLDLENHAPFYRQRLGLGDLTCVQFSPDRNTAQVELYLPDHLPLPNTPHFQPALLVELRRLLTLSATAPGFVVLLINDIPLKFQVGTTLAAEFGSRIQVETLDLNPNSVLISGWAFWQQHQAALPAPHLLVMATLPFPSLEDPLVAGQVAYYKHLHQDWFRGYLLPQALMTLQRAIAPVRRSQGVVALLDSRVLHRSYGQQILTILSPVIRLNYLDPSLFGSPKNLVLD
jgi:ATP-dependent DNA helicase DinG